MKLRKTKIICTIGPATDQVDSLVDLINAGMDVARLNFSHGTLEYHNQLINNIREASQIAEKDIAILQDLQGPKIRIENVENNAVEIFDGEELIITTDDIEIGNAKVVATSYKELVSDLKVGSTLLLDDGYLILKVEKIDGSNIYTKIIKGGILKSRKGIVAPGISFSAPSMSDKDIADLKFGLEHGVDSVALSFVRNERDIIELKNTMRIFGRVAHTIAKIERPEALKSINEILNEVDGIMVARGDLGLELPPEEVPIIQKDLIKRSNYYGKPVITATQMLESMINNPRPTRAEASDVANAVLDGTDCVMLSAETGTGKYPIESVNYMHRILKSVENNYTYSTIQTKHFKNEEHDISEAFGKAACLIAEQVNANLIVALTNSTYTAKKIAKYRPKVPIIGVTNDETVHRILNFVWGVKPLLVKENMDYVSNIDKFKELLIANNFAKQGELIVFISGLTANTLGGNDSIKLFYV